MDLSKFEKLSLLMKAIDADIDVVLVVSSRYNLKISKIERIDGVSTGEGLKDVKFCLYRIDPLAESVPKVSLSELIAGTKGMPATDTYLDKERTKPFPAEGALTEDGGILSIYGMTSGHYYYLVETQALPGYASQKQMVRFYIEPDTGIIVMQKLDANGDVIEDAVRFHYQDAVAETGTVPLADGDFVKISVFNDKRLEMPETGGSGNLIFLLLAMLFEIFAVVLIFRRYYITKNKE